MTVVLNIALALVVPIGWGVLSAWFFDYIRAKRAPKPCDKGEN